MYITFLRTFFRELNMKFRNYLPHDKQLQEGKLAPAVLPKFEDPVAAAPIMAEKIEVRYIVFTAPEMCLYCTRNMDN